MFQRTISRQIMLNILKVLSVLILCCVLAACDITISLPTSGGGCQSNCTTGTGANGLGLIVEPDAGPGPIVDAIHNAKKSIDLEIYLLTNKNVINALEEDANNEIAVRVMLEQHLYGGGSVSPRETLDKLQAAGVKTQFSDPAFALTHEKGMVVDDATAYIMTTMCSFCFST